MSFRRCFPWVAVLGMVALTACCDTRHQAAAPSTTVTTPPPPPPAPVVASPAVKAPPVAGNGPLSNSIFAWDSELKSVDATEGDPETHLFFTFTNISPDDVVILNVHPGCGCTSAQLPPTPWTIKPGESDQIPLTVNLRGRPVGTQFKNLTITTDKGVKTLNFRVNIKPMVLPLLSPADRAKNVQIATADRQAIFKGACIQCHVKPGDSKYGKPLYDAICGICHDDPNRAASVPDLHNLKVATNTDFWRTWTAHGKPGSLMPAFSNADGGPLNDMQIASIAVYLNFAIPSKVPAGQ